MTHHLPEKETKRNTCNVCGGPLPRGRSKFCSGPCGRFGEKHTPKALARRRANRKAARAQAGGAVVVVVFDSHAIFERDSWTCQECMKPTPPHLAGYQLPDSPTLDHHVPLCDGGDHTPENARTLCNACNEAKAQGEASRASSAAWAGRRGR